MDNFEESSWTFSEIALVENFEDSLTGIGVDISDSIFSMRDAISALPQANNNDNKNDSRQKSQDDDSSLNIKCTLKASTSPATKMDEDTLTYLNQGYPYELKFETNDDEAINVRSVIKVCFFERRMQFMEREHWENWRQSHSGERVLDIDIPHSHGFLDLHVDKRNINSVCVNWNTNRPCGVYVRLNCISTEFTAKKHGGEKGVPFRVQVDSFSSDDKHLHSCACQVKVFKPKGADRKQKTDREKIEKRSDTERSRYRPSSAWTELAEVPFNMNTIQQHQCVSSTSQKKIKAGSLCPSQYQSPITDSSAASYSPISTEGFNVPEVNVKPLIGNSAFFKPSSKLTAGDGSSQYYYPDSITASAGEVSQYKNLSGDHEYPVNNTFNYHLVNNWSGNSPCINDDSESPSKEDRYSQRTVNDQSASPHSGENSCSGSSDTSVKQTSVTAVNHSHPTICLTSSPTEVSHWLAHNGFQNIVSHLSNMSGLDMARLSRSDLYEIVGKSEAIRLINAINSRPPRPKLTLYLKKENENDFNAVYMHNLTYFELLFRLANIYNADRSQIDKIVLIGPNQVPIAITNEVVSNFDNEDCFIMRVVSHSSKAVIELTRLTASNMHSP